jgi:hypothetical protein
MASASVRRWFRRVVMGTVLVAALLAGAGTAWAFWSAAVNLSGPGKVNSGSFDLVVADGADATLKGPGGSATIPALTMANAVPGNGDSVSVTIQNSGDAPMVVTAQTARTGTLDASFGTTVVFGGTVSGTGCAGSGGSTSPTIRPGDQITLCVAVRLDPAAPAGSQGESGTIRVTLEATQVRP